MNEKQLGEGGPLIGRKGELNDTGYAFGLTKEFNKKDVKNKFRLKEWDYYYFGNDKYAFAIVVGDLRYAGQFGLVFFDFKNKLLIDKSKLLPLTFGRLNLPTNSDVSYTRKSGKDIISIEVNPKDKTRHIKVHYRKFYMGKDFDADIDVSQICNDSMVVSTPFEKKKHFYYNQKINNLLAKGPVKIGDKDYNDKNDFMGVLDWGRGVWTYENTWNWCSINAKFGNDYIGLNLGNGFGDLSKCGENMAFINQTAYKLKQVEIRYSKTKDKKIDYTKQVILKTLKSYKEEVYLTFTPVFLRTVNINALIIKQNTNQMFGYFTGYVTVGGKQVVFTNIFGFLERVFNRW